MQRLWLSLAFWINKYNCIKILQLINFIEITNIKSSPANLVHISLGKSDGAYGALAISIAYGIFNAFFAEYMRTGS